jgi:hypothetical protein
MAISAALRAVLARIFVNAGGYGFVATILSSDFFFAFATHTPFWLLIFLPTLFVPFIALAPSAADTTAFVSATVFFVPLTVLLGSAIGAGLAALLNIGQPIDVWMSPPTRDNDTRSVPLLPVSIILAFFGTLLLVAWQTPSTFAYGLLPVPVDWAAALFGMLLVVAAVVTLLLSMRADRSDPMSVGYMLGLTLIFVVQETLSTFIVGTPPTAVTSTVSLFFVALAIGAVDAFVLAVGYYAEMRIARVATGRFYAPERSGWANGLRAIAFVVMHVVGFFVYGTMVRFSTMDEVTAMFAMPNFTLFYAIAGGAIVLLYIVYRLILLATARGADSSPAALLPVKEAKIAEPARWIDAAPSDASRSHAQSLLGSVRGGGARQRRGLSTAASYNYHVL